MNSDRELLLNLREELENNYEQIFDLIDVRREIVAKIFKVKDGKKGFDRSREEQLVIKFQKRLSKLSIRELLALSLLIEEHASSVGEYPAWSSRIHLESSSLKGELYEMINPIWLQTLHPTIYQLLNLKSKS